MDALSDPDVIEIVVMKASQIGWTEIINNVVGYYIHQDAAPILVIQPTLQVGKAWSNDRLAPMIRDTPALATIFDKIRARDRNNTQLYKKFPGGHVTIAGANSPASLSSRPIRIVLGDEVDRYPASAGDEGDPLSLAFKRTANFWNRKRLSGSTPTIAGHSRIEEGFEQSDKRLFHVPCPECGDRQVLKWSQVRWTNGAPDTAAYVCEHCGALWDDAARIEAIGGGEWIASAPFTGIAGFHCWQIHSSWVTMADMVREFVAAGGNQERLKVFVNTALGETWKEKGEAPEWQRLYERAEDWAIGSVPAGVHFLTLGIDVQHDRIEVAVWGWGPGVESWLIDHRVLEGDPYAETVWAALDALMSETWTHAGGVQMAPVGVAIDIGYATTEVYKWARRQRPGLVMCVKGVEHGAAAVGIPSAIDIAPKLGDKKKRRSGTVWPVVAGIYKSELYGFLKLDAPTRESGDSYPAGFVHLPKFSDEVFKQLTAEQLVTKVIKFRRKTAWEKTRERNEQLDMRVYARAAAARFGMDRFKDRHWQRLARHLTAKAPTPPRPAAKTETEVEREVVPAAIEAERLRMSRRDHRPGGWLNRSRRGPWLKR